MSDSLNTSDPAYNAMAVDMLSRFLRQADRADIVSAQLVDDMREFTGARCAVLVQCLGGRDPLKFRVLGFSPARRRSWVESPRAARLYEITHGLKTPAICRSTDSSQEADVLREEGYDLSFCVPLKVGDIRVGTLLLLGLQEETHLDTERELLGTLADVVALVLRNALLIEGQEQAIRERTENLQRANESLRVSETRALELLETAEQSRRALLDVLEEQKRVEQALRESEQLFQQLIEQAGDGFELLDEEGRLLHVNTASCRQLGYAREEMLGLSVSDIDPLVSREKYRQYLDAIAVKTHVALETVHRRKDGTQFPVEIAASVIELKGKRCCLAMVRDVTERKQAEEERAKLQAQLTQAQKMESIGRLAGGVAHDFNNMLQAILANVTLSLAEVPPGSPVRENLEEIEKCARHSVELTRQLLAFARKQTVMTRVLDLNETVGGMLKMLQRLIGEDITLSWNPAQELWPVRIDPSQVDQILANLCVNARDAIHGHGTGKIILETSNLQIDAAYAAEHSEVVPGDYVRLAVSDSGCGMTKEVLAQLFEPFFTTKATGKGTGLGLATVYGIIKQNQGFINVYSEPGHGTTFTICLPRHWDKAARKETALAEAVVGGTETILLVEDEPAILRVAKRCLENLGYTVLAADTPGKALSLAEDHRGEIQLLITDVIMPEMNGRELARQLLAFYPNMSRLFMSGYTDDIIAHNGILREGIHFIQKPFTVEALADKVRQALCTAK